MNSVFIGGSRRLGRMNPELAQRLENIIERRLHVLVGDANGFDRVAQMFLAKKAYGDVTVYCTSGECRNNIGKWPQRAVAFEGRSHTFEFYIAKDDAMAQDAQYGLFAWDGKSKGTFRNIRNMAILKKPSVVYVSADRKFVNIQDCEDVERLAQQADSSVTGELLALGEPPAK